jgi:hypothetical protein
MPYRRRQSSRRKPVQALLVGTTLVLGLLAGTAQAAPSGVPSSNPAAVNILVNQDNSVITAHNSPSLAQNPVKPAQLAVVDRVDRPDYTATIHVSNDEGKTWQDATLVRPAGSMSKLFAPTAVFDGRGILYVQFVTLSGPGNGPDSVWIERSSDGGVTFDQPSQVAGANAFQTTLAVDQKTGRLFAAWLQSNATATHCNLCFAQTGLPIMVTYSDTQGRSWSPPAQVSDPGRARIGAPALAVDGQGNPSIVYYDYGSDRVDWENLAGTYDAKFSLIVSRSGDRGLTYSAGRVVDADIVPPHRFLVYLPDSPGFAIGSDGRMVAAWADARSGESDIWSRSSGDGGVTWTAPVRVNGDPGGDGVSKDHPAVSVAPGGRVDVLYYDRILDHRGTTADVFVSSSHNGGRSFPGVVRVSSQSSDRAVGPQGSPYDNEADFGTRLALLSGKSQAIAVWTDTRSGTVDTGRQDIYSGVVAFPGANGITAAQLAIAGLGVLLGMVGVALFVSSRRKSTPGQAPPLPPSRLETPPPLPPLVPTPGQV